MARKKESEPEKKDRRKPFRMVRLPPELGMRLEPLAARERRSVNAMVAWIVGNWLDSEEAKEK